MKKARTHAAILTALFTTTALLASVQANAYVQYSPDCTACHGSFSGGMSPKGTTFPSGSKHVMHNGSGDMATSCLLCHSTMGDNPMIGQSAGTNGNPGIGCTGCHGRDGDMGFDLLSAGRGAGLRQHHWNAGVTICGECHTDADPSRYTPVGENEKPPYYGTADTNADDPCNPVPAGKVNENWSVGDFEGLDNDGDGLIDGLDPDCQVATTTTSITTTTLPATTTTLAVTTTTVIATTTTVAPTSTTSTTLPPLRPCSQPISTGSRPTASDCLFILKAAVGSVTCTPACMCAPKGSLPITATDALVCLKNAVGQPVALNCPC